MRHAALFAVFATGCTGMIETDTMPPPPATDVEVAVHDGQTPQPGITVLFQNADTTLAAEVVTDASGIAKLDSFTAGNVTVIRTYPTPPGQQDPVPAEVYTYVGVKAGDKLQLGKVTDDHDTPSAIVVTVPATTTGTVKVTSACGSGEGQAPSVPITVRTCGPEIALYLEDGNRDSLFQKLPFATNVDVSAGQFLASLASTVTATNVQPNTEVTVEQRLAADGFAFFSTGEKRVDQTPANINQPQLGDSVESLVLTKVSTNGTTQIVATRSAYNQDTVAVDATAGLIETVSNQQDTATGVTWTEDGVVAPDALLVKLTVTPDAAGTRLPFTRYVIAPHTGASFDAPALVGSGQTYNLLRGDQVNTALGLVQGTGGYDALRARAFAVDSIVDATPMGGRITLSYTGNRPTR